MELELWRAATAPRRLPPPPPLPPHRFPSSRWTTTSSDGAGSASTASHCGRPGVSSCTTPLHACSACAAPSASTGCSCSPRPDPAHVRRHPHRRRVQPAALLHTLNNVFQSGAWPSSGSGFCHRRTRQHPLLLGSYGGEWAGNGRRQARSRPELRRRWPRPRQ